MPPTTPCSRSARAAATGVKCQHISNNAPTNLASPDEALRKAGVEVGKKWLDGARSQVRPNAIPRSGDGYPRKEEIIPHFAKAIESYKEMADHGGNLGIRVTFENHWGLAADPMNIRITTGSVPRESCSPAGSRGPSALEYEAGPLNGIEGAQYLFKEVMAALASPVPVI